VNTATQTHNADWTELDGCRITPRQWLVIVAVLAMMHLLAFSPWVSSLLQTANTVTVQTIQMRLSQGGEIMVSNPPQRQEMQAPVALPEEETAGNELELSAAETTEEPAAMQAPEPAAKPQAPEIAQRPAQPLHSVAAIPIPKPAAPDMQEASSEAAGTTLDKAQSVQEKRVKMSATTAAASSGNAAVASGSGQGVQLVRGNPAVMNEKERATALVVARYEQLLSGWIEQHRRMPEYAMEQGMSGKALVFIRIDRGGNILFSRLEKRTGEPILDRAVMDMIRRANPVPPVPADYPAGDQFAFRIPVNFSVSKKQ
jgi:protein TonB